MTDPDRIPLAYMLLVLATVGMTVAGLVVLIRLAMQSVAG